MAENEHYRGSFSTIESCIACVVNPENEDYALIGTTDSYWYYRDGEWKDSSIPPNPQD